MSKSNLSVGTKIWADKINTAWRASALMVATEVGQHLIDAKANVPHGDFERMVRQELDFGPQTARKLMKVASDTRIRDRAQGRALPDHWTTYYEMTKLSNEELDEAFASGVVNSDMRRSDVPKKRKESLQGEDSAVIEQDAVRAAVVDQEMKPSEAHIEAMDEAGGSSETNTRPPLGAQGKGTPQTPRRGGGERPTINSDGEDSAVTTYLNDAGAVVWQEFEQSDAARQFAKGLMVAIAASRELDPRDAAMHWPKELPLSLDDITDFYSWLYPFEDARRALQK